MKTKHILTAMVLPAMFAACTAEEIVENNNAVAVNRANVEAVSFAINGVDSRLEYNDSKLGWDWEDTDKFLIFSADNGAAPYVGTKANPAYPGQRFTVGKNPVGGYEYEKNEDGVYTTKASVMGEGLYWGYAPSFDKQARGLISYELATSQDAEYYKSEAAQALITPLYEVNAEVYNNQLPLEMVNWYSTVIIPLKNSTGEDITLNQIVLEVATGNPFQVKGLIDMNAMGKYIMAYDGEKWDAVQNYDKDKTNNLDLEEGEFIEKFRKEYMTTTDKENNVTSQALLLNLNGEVLEAGDTKEFYILAPASDGKISCNIRILAEEGYYEITSKSTSNYLKQTNIYHNGQKAAFGWQTVKGVTTAKAFNIKELKEGGQKYYYVASYDDMMELLNSVNGQINVFNVGDWNIDAEMAEAINESDCFVNFVSNVNVGASTESRAASKEEIEFTKIGFSGVATVKEGTVVTFTTRTNDYDNVLSGTLIIEEDAEVIAKYGDFTQGEFVVEEGGKLTVKETADATAYDGNGNVEVYSGTTNEIVAVISNEGETTLVGQNKVTVIQNGGKLNLNSKNAANAVVYESKYIKFPEGKTFVTVTDANSDFIVNEDMTLHYFIDDETGIAYYATLELNGDLRLNEDLLVESYMTVEGETTGEGELKVNGVLTNNGDAEDVNLIVNGQLNNNGIAKNVTNNSLIIAGARSKTHVVDTDRKATDVPAEIDNTNEAQVSYKDDIKQVVYYTVEDGTKIEDLENILFKRYNVNTLNVNGTLTLDRPFKTVEDGFNYYEQLMCIKNLRLAHNAEVVVDGTVQVGIENIILRGDATISGWSKSESKLILTAKNPNIYMLNKCVEKTNANENVVGYTLLVDDVDVQAQNGVLTFYTEEELKPHTSSKGYRHETALVVTKDAYFIAPLVKGGNENTDVNFKGAAVKQESVEVETLAELKAAIALGENVTLTDNIVGLTETLNITSDLTINLNGKTISTNGGTIFMIEGAKVEIEGEGKVESKSDANLIIVSGEKGKLTVNGGHFVGTIANMKKGQILINDGYFEAYQDGKNYNNDFCCLNRSEESDPDGDIILVKGGTFKKWNPAYHHSEGKVGNYVHVDYKVTVWNFTKSCGDYEYNGKMVSEQPYDANNWSNHIEYTVVSKE